MSMGPASFPSPGSPASCSSTRWWSPLRASGPCTCRGGSMWRRSWLGRSARAIWYSPWEPETSPWLGRKPCPSWSGERSVEGEAATPSALTEAEGLLREIAGERVRRDFPLAPLTSFRLGGRAAMFLEAESLDDLDAAGRAVRKTSLPVVVLGKGSNVLVSDRGFPGLVLRLGRAFRWAARDGDRISAGGAMPLPALARGALSHSLAGLEFGVAIPASLGGSVRMNAGAHGHSLDEVLESVELFLLAEGRSLVIPAREAGFRYRHSELPEQGVVMGASVLLRPGDA